MTSDRAVERLTDLTSIVLKATCVCNLVANTIGQLANVITQPDLNLAVVESNMASSFNQLPEKSAPNALLQYDAKVSSPFQIYCDTFNNISMFMLRTSAYWDRSGWKIQYLVT